MDEEIPSKEDTTFMLSPAPCTTASGRSGVDESLVIFCVDTSGSMCVTTEVSSVKQYNNNNNNNTNNSYLFILGLHILANG